MFLTTNHKFYKLSDDFFPVLIVYPKRIVHFEWLKKITYGYNTRSFEKNIGRKSLKFE